ncbi:nucleotide sugar dehydrogenase [Herpetosiphon geysericola]|uniref:UDP-N-acetyl-D-glucosamine dehydrogenase n=1 Tax=Herpetosiphon geysericola TaxID=70996 RepID=A0A0P6XN06_9CHLR|nr:nucleotide sugar dehydrogenase [Herpetosiphon geysericola]KPL81238.1 UDP-N-acetyl-D-glucosamine dehydrogenase [Herpetosiphon geysericola]
MSTFADLRSAIETRRAQVGVIGMGYVGLPMLARAGNVGFNVLGFDISVERIASINNGVSYIGDVPSSDLAALRNNNLIEATAQFERLRDCDIIIICMPTPLNEARDPDMSYIEAATNEIAERLRPGQLIILESTTYPGTTVEVLKPAFDACNLTVGEDYFLAFSPERIDPGSVNFKVHNIPKVVGGVTPQCNELTSLFYGHIVSAVTEVSSPAAAEMTKLFENIFRNVNIALVNELTLICDRMGLNVWEIIDAAATKPFGFMRFTPGPGLGGHCIPLDPFYLAWKARHYDISARFIELAGEINLTMPRFVRDRISHALNDQERSIKGSTIVLLGVAYKKDIDDYRESPIFKVMDLLAADGANVYCCDPHVTVFYDHHNHEYQTVPLTDELLQQAHCSVIITDHSAFDYANIVAQSKVVVDTRNATREVKTHREKIRLL